MKIPVKISPCPITEAIVEIRFDYAVDLDPDAIYGIVYKALHDKYPKTKKLPILQLPEEMRLNDPNLKNKPYYQLLSDKYILQVGSTVMSLSNVGEYVGWETYSKELIETFSLIKTLDIIKKITRVGLRYVNFIENFNILDNVDLNIQLHEKNFKDINTFLRSEVPCGNFMSTLQIGNHMNIDRGGKTLMGSIIDIDTYCAGELEDFFDKMPDLLKEGHEEEKKLFFDLLSDEYLSTLNPEY